MDVLPETIISVLGSISLQFFTNRKNNELNRKLQEQQREQLRANEAHDEERMLKLQKESAKVALQLELEAHRQRVKDIENNYNDVIKQFANNFAIEHWPLSVLPFIMRGESFGSLFSGMRQAINMHCVLTPSNCRWFNELYNGLDSGVENYMNTFWNTQSSHPVVYYGGGWTRKRNGIACEIDSVDIDLLNNHLRNIPFMVITPYFNPNLQFRIRLWGMGENGNNEFIFDAPQKQQGSSFGFTYEYNKDNGPVLNENFADITLSELVPYIVCLIGFVADKYYGSMYSVRPILSELISGGDIKSYIDFDPVFQSDEYKTLNLLPPEATQEIESISDSKTPITTVVEKQPRKKGTPPTLSGTITFLDNLQNS